MAEWLIAIWQFNNLTRTGNPYHFLTELSGYWFLKFIKISRRFEIKNPKGLNLNNRR